MLNEMIVDEQAVETNIIFPMAEAEARSLTREIKGHLRDARNQVLVFYRARGWLVMGYANFKEWAIGEFEVSWQQVYNILNAAEVDENLTVLSPQGESFFVPVKHATALNKLKKPEDQYRAYSIAQQEATAQGKDTPTEDIVAHAVFTVKTESIFQESPYPYVRNLLSFGEISLMDASKFTKELDRLDNAPAQKYILSLMRRFDMRNPDLVYPLGHKHKVELQRGKDSYVLNEIELTGSLAGTHLSKANSSDLWRANAEQQQQHIAESEEQRRLELLAAGQVLPEQIVVNLWKNAPIKTAKILIKELPPKDLQDVFDLLAKHLGYTDGVGAALANRNGASFVYEISNGLPLEKGQEVEVFMRVKVIEENG